MRGPLAPYETTQERHTMKAMAVYPGKPNSMHLEEIPMPKVTDIAGGRGVLVKVLRVGVDGTNKEINAAEYGKAPGARTSLSSATKTSVKL